MVEPLLPQNHGLSFWAISSVFPWMNAFLSFLISFALAIDTRLGIMSSFHGFTWLQTHRRHNNAKNTTTNDENPQKNSSYCKNSTQASYSYQENVVLCVGIIMAWAASLSCQERAKLFHGNSFAVPWSHQLILCAVSHSMAGTALRLWGREWRNFLWQCSQCQLLLTLGQLHFLDGYICVPHKLMVL